MILDISSSSLLRQRDAVGVVSTWNMVNLYDSAGSVARNARHTTAKCASTGQR